MLEIAGVLNQPQLDKLHAIAEQARFVESGNDTTSTEPKDHS